MLGIRYVTRQWSDRALRASLQDQFA
ncbi:hypothetical protein HD596_002507 [Nonomuraea jabiensis]|uniref:Uncharacterized protein n=1 Tax=Nonomuraea jabiensis TaxID=882448 RepID=A0A7W9L9N3_9ACTN|nr:hypothetical protein [Nonomuraea jabiensis]